MMPVLKGHVRAYDPIFEHSQHLSTSSQVVMSALDRAEGTPVSGEKTVVDAKAMQSSLVDWLWDNAEHEHSSSMPDIAVELDGTVPPGTICTPPGLAQLGLVMKVKGDMTRCGSACDVAARASKGGYAKFVALGSLSIGPKATKLYDMFDEPLVLQLSLASDKLVDVVAKNQLGTQ